jgi:PKHD-type hydroxylase
VRQLNGQFYKYDLQGFAENFQYTVYNGEAEEPGHYTWHQDWNNSGTPRKLSLVVQLSDPSEYEGGDLQIMSGAEPTTVDKGLGKVVLFPSFMLHRVTPVTKGIRRSLVVWVTGPAFK